MEKADLEALCPIIEKYDLLVVSDEIYKAELSYKSAHVSIASLPGMRERTIVINGFSKAFAMTGWRLWLCACTCAYYEADDKAASVCDYVCTDDQSICGHQCLKRMAIRM